MSDGTSHRRELLLRNAGRSPVMISRIISSCSCFVTEWAGGLIGPRSERSVAVTIVPRTWGAGRRKSALAVVCGDGSAQTCTITGNGLVPEDRQRITVTPKQLYFDASFGDAEASLPSTCTSSSPRPIPDPSKLMQQIARNGSPCKCLNRVRRESQAGLRSR